MMDAHTLMSSFAQRTGLTSKRPPQRYLWTDAFAVCNFLEQGDAALARRLVDRVHGTLGHHRDDDTRRGWLPSASEAHPTAGGLRIGKKLPERREDEPFDEGLEWDRDGQYFHYLTKWMHALDQAGLNAWARELAVAAHRAFVRGRRMAWKMSIDLSRPLVASMGQHDPLDGFITFTQLETTAAIMGAPREPSLAAAIADFRVMLRDVDFMTTDPLGIGGLLFDAGRVEQLLHRGARIEPRLLGELLAAAAVGLTRYTAEREWALPASHRLAFRELGLAIGLRALDRIEPARALRRHAPLGVAIESFWMDESNQRTHAWLAHRDINDVMLATCLRPDGFLGLNDATARPLRATST